MAAFDTLEPYAYKADLGRYCLLYALGGTYVDLSWRFINPIKPPNDAGIVAFKDRPFTSRSWTIMQNSVIFAKPRRSEFEIAIDWIVKNCKSRYYGDNPLYPTGPILFGRAVTTANAMKPPQSGDDDRWIGETRTLTPGHENENCCLVTPDQSLIAVSVKRIAGDLSHLGAVGTNNYNIIWCERRVYGEKKSLLNRVFRKSPLAEPAPES